MGGFCKINLFLANQPYPIKNAKKIAQITSI